MMLGRRVIMVSRTPAIGDGSEWMCLAAPTVRANGGLACRVLLRLRAAEKELMFLLICGTMGDEMMKARGC